MHNNDRIVAVFSVLNDNFGAFFDLTRKDFFGYRTLAKLSDPPADMPCTAGGFIALADAFYSFICIFKIDSFISQTFCKRIKLSLANQRNAFFGQRREDDALVDSVNELGTECLAKSTHDSLFA